MPVIMPRTWLSTMQKCGHTEKYEFLGNVREESSLQEASLPNIYFQCRIGNPGTGDRQSSLRSCVRNYCERRHIGTDGLNADVLVVHGHIICPSVYKFRNSTSEILIRLPVAFPACENESKPMVLGWIFLFPSLRYLVAQPVGTASFWLCFAFS